MTQYSLTKWPFEPDGQPRTVTFMRMHSSASFYFRFPPKRWNNGIVIVSLLRLFLRGVSTLGLMFTSPLMSRALDTEVSVVLFGDSRRKWEWIRGGKLH